MSARQLPYNSPEKSVITIRVLFCELSTPKKRIKKRSAIAFETEKYWSAIAFFQVQKGDRGFCGSKYYPCLPPLICFWVHTITCWYSPRLLYRFWTHFRGFLTLTLATSGKTTYKNRRYGRIWFWVWGINITNNRWLGKISARYLRTSESRTWSWEIE